MNELSKSGVPNLIVSDQDYATGHNETGLIFNYRNILDTITEGIYAIGKSGKCVYANSACCRTLGFASDAELLNQNMHRLIHHSHADHTIYPAESCKIGRALRDGIEIIADDEVFWSKTRSAIPVRYHAYPQYEGSELIGAVVSFYDISAELKQKKLLEASENRFRNIFANAHAGIVYFDENNLTLSANPEFLDLVQYSLEELRTMHITDLIVEDDWNREQPLREELLNAKRDTYSLEKRYIRKDNTIVWVLSHVSGFKHDLDAQYNFVAVVTDISKRKSMELQLKERNESMNKFISIISHDLRNPIGSIKSLAALMLDELSAAHTDSIREYVQLITDQADHTFDLLNNLLNWSKSQFVFQKFQLEEIALLNIITETVDQLTLMAFNKSVKINVISPDNIKVHAERNMLATVLRNLLTNAIKFSYESSEINLAVVEDLNKITISVQDHGSGISAAIRDQLFANGLPFTTQGTANEIGTGLGLLLSKEIIELLGGKIWVESEEKKGTIFYFTLRKTRN
jgi:two-component system sensor histidine kinase/response regulator